MKISAVTVDTAMAGSSGAISAPHPASGSSQTEAALGGGGSVSRAEFKQTAVISSSRTEEASGGGAPVGQEELKKIVEQMQSHLDSMNISLQYTLYGEHHNKIAVKVVDKGTGDLIREIPPKEIQALQAKMSELVGMIFNREA